MPQFDVVVVGLGITGSAAAAELARRGLRVLGLDRHTPGHDLGSSHGESRIIRLGYFEHPSYVPLLRRAYGLWRELEAAAEAQLLHITGIAEIGRPDSEVVSGTLAASRQHGLAHEVLGATEAMQRFPAFRLPDDFVCVFQPDGGWIAADLALQAMLVQAKHHGADIRAGVTVEAVTPDGQDVRVRTTEGDIEARAAIIAAGPWIGRLVPSLPLRVTRQVVTWFAPREPRLFEPARFPVFLLESRHGAHYGFPLSAAGLVKTARHHHLDQTADPDHVERGFSADDEAAIRPAIAAHISAADGRPAATQTCLYTVTADRHFIVDRLPDAPQIVVASACSGHGFKFAPVLAEALADLATRGETAHDVGRFSLSRFP